MEDAYEVAQDSYDNVLDVLSNDSDADGEALVIVGVVPPTYGTAVDNDFNILYTPDPGFSGTDIFSYIVTDGNGGYATALVTIIVLGAPVADDLSFSTPEDTPYSGTLTASDPDSSLLTYAIESDPLHGTLLVAAGGAFTYTPVLNYYGADAFAFVVSDGVLTDTGQVSITVTAVDYATALALSASPSPSGLGQVVTFTVVVSTNLRAPNGMVTFLDGATPLLTLPLDENGVAVFSTDALALGDHAISGAYLGAEDYQASSQVLTHTVAYMADLQVTIQAALQPLLVTYVVEVYNPGFNVADGTRVQTSVSPDLSEIAWTCSRQRRGGLHAQRRGRCG